MMKIFKKTLIKISILSLLISPSMALAAMQSNSYILYENIHHAFDGPVITSVSSSVSGLTASISWETDVVADSFVVYSTDSSVPSSASMEQGSSLKNSTSHNVSLSGLSAETTYYYQVKSTRINGGTTIEPTIRSFSTGQDPDAQEQSQQSSSGGGVIIIDKTDTEAPEISNINARPLNSSSISITWQTNEEATSFVEYGETVNFGSVDGSWASTTEHEVVLEKLDSNTNYYYRVLSSDSWGNLAISETLNFYLASEESDETSTSTEEDLTEPEPEPEPEPETPEPTIVDNTLDFLRRLFPQLSLNDLGDEDLRGIESYEDLSSYLAAPVLSGTPQIEVGATEATISWQTDIDATAQVAITPENQYNPDADEPYYQIVGNTDEYRTDHSVTVYGLEPDTSYHYQLRSKPQAGPTALSRDYTFSTSLETLSIESFFSQVINTEEAIFKWVTNKNSNSVVKFAPYHNNIVALDEQKIIRENGMTVIHEIRVSELQAGIFYDVIIESTDADGNTASETLNRFSTSEDDLPPEISHVKADSTVFLDRSNKTQTIISWLTNEPSTSRVYFQEGVHGGNVDLQESTDMNDNYTKEHVMVVTEFKPGLVYSFRVESTDSGGNTSISKVHTFMTAKQRESIIQIIIRIFEDTFGWVKKLM